MSFPSATEIDVLEVIPQRAPIVMIDVLQHADSVKTISTFEIKDTCIFCDKGFLSESGMIENIAQTGAAGFGYLDKQQNKEISLGFIASIKNIEILEMPTVGSVITTEVIAQEPVLGFNIIIGKIILNDAVIASCEMRIFVQP
jgi:predicted hotdog family 3-hydroxylacyl-ACP dehydratase